MFKNFMKNWRALAFPIGVIFIIFVDFIIGTPFIVNISKILILSILHYIYVLRTKYVYNSDIYIYLSDLKEEMNRNNVIKPFLSRNFFQGLCLVTYFGTFCGLYFMDFLLSDYSWVWILLSLSYCIILFDVIIELLRLWTNKADLNRVKVPHSLQQTRGMWKFLTRTGPACAKIAAGVGTLVAISEVGYPMASGGPLKIGLLTHYHVNNQLYTDLAFPVETRFDITYEYAWHLNEQNVNQGVKEYNPLKKRTFNITSPSELAKLLN